MVPEEESPHYGEGDASFQAAGGEAGIRRLVDRFYDLMEERPDATGIRKMHPRNLEGSREKKFTKNMAVDLLERNSESDMFCRFSKSRKRNAIVVQVDQIVKNMDDGEFRSHIDQVAIVADNYEKQVLGKDKY